jgi:sporadic carbohydrate cluster 2OG-Fe(II) oxygenase
MGMNHRSLLKSFEQSGYVVVEAEDKLPLIESRSKIAEFLRNEYNLVDPDDESLLNTIHDCTNLDDAAANRLVMSAIGYYAKHLDMSEVVFSACQSFLSSVLGPDIASQRNPNIVFQYPLSSRYSELHTDAPANSRYEIVAWVPLVNCYGTKSFYIVDHEASMDMLRRYGSQNEFGSWEAFKEEAVSRSTSLEIGFGSILFFSTSLLHGSAVNCTNESRWTLNTRFKSLFAPCGLKDPFSFYKVFRRSSLTNLALRSQ